MVDWQANASGVVGSGVVHAVGAVSLLLSLPIVSHCPWFRGDQLLRTHDAGPPMAFFEMIPDVPTSAQVDASWAADECVAAARRVPAPALIGAGGFVPAASYARAPRLCVRVGADGRVLAARVLRSSGRRASDRMLEVEARRLLFTPAERDGQAVAATITLDVVGGGRLDRSPDVPVETPLFAPL